jgi:hypothetical protein
MMVAHKQKHNERRQRKESKRYPARDYILR